MSTTEENIMSTTEENTNQQVESVQPVESIESIEAISGNSEEAIEAEQEQQSAQIEQDVAYECEQQYITRRCMQAVAVQLLMEKTLKTLWKNHIMS